MNKNLYSIFCVFPEQNKNYLLAFPLNLGRGTCLGFPKVEHTKLASKPATSQAHMSVLLRTVGH